MKYSVLVPAFNEEENIPLLAEQFHQVFAKGGDSAELIIIDDGSTDRTAAEAERAQKKFPFIKVISYSHNMGKTHALLCGFREAKGDILVVFDADLQFDPWDVPRLVDEIRNGADISTGWKQGDYDKKMISAVYNYLSRRLFNIKVRDLNSIKAFKREVVQNVCLRKDWHRYLIVLAADQGYRISEIKVNLYPRKFGTSKYSGWGRILIGFLDLWSVKFQISFMKKPLLLFGSIGLALFFLGLVAGITALVLRFGFEIGFRPLLYLVILLVISGFLFFILGFLAEAIANISEKVEDLKNTIKSKKSSE
jgi:glycosyltransferase involved in cell wall biosynthesis